MLLQVAMAGVCLAIIIAPQTRSGEWRPVNPAPPGGLKRYPVPLLYSQLDSAGRGMKHTMQHLSMQVSCPS